MQSAILFYQFCPSVHPMPIMCLNEWTSSHFFKVWYGIILVSRAVYRRYKIPWGTRFNATYFTGYRSSNELSSELQCSAWRFDCVRGTCPSYFCGICTPVTEVGGRVRLRSAHRGDLCVSSTRTEFGKRSFRVAAPRTWNSLPLHLRSQNISRQQFQSALKTHLFKHAYI